MLLFGAGLLGIGSFTQINGITSAVNNFFDPDNSKTIKLSGGKTGFNGTVPANCLKVVAAKAGTITVVASQKNDTANVRTDVNLVLFGADGTKIATSTEVLSANDGTLSVITFEITEAGTYYIGSSNNGCFVFAVSYTYAK